MSSGSEQANFEIERSVAIAVSHFNARRYWHAHDGWREAALRSPAEDRLFYEGLLLVTWGLGHIQSRQAAPARRELRAGLALLRPYGPVHGDLVVEEVVDVCIRLVGQLDEGLLPYLIPPLLKHAPSISGSVASS